MTFPPCQNEMNEKKQNNPNFFVFERQVQLHSSLLGARLSQTSCFILCNVFCVYKKNLSGNTTSYETVKNINNKLS